MKLGHPRLHLTQTTSTNDDARRLVSAGAPAGLLVTASQQTSGRGRRGRSWSAPAGQALLMSLALPDDHMLTLRAAIAVAAACGPQAAIKWPNDILVDGRKVAGILCEARSGEPLVIAGIGVNVAVAPELLPPDAAAVAGTLGRRPDEIEDFLAALLAELEQALSLSSEVVLERWRARDALLGETVRWPGGSGVAAGVDQVGRLRVELADGAVALLDAGEVTLATSS